jgi:4-hydroxy-tetrahydrodipicolinate synthase
LITPFGEDGEIDFTGVRQVVDFVLAAGIHSVMVGGTTGEGMLLSLDERKALCEAVLAQVNGRVPVIVHTGCIDTRSTIELSQHARSTGASILSAIVPYFFTLEEEQVYRHFIHVAQSVPEMPLLLYAFPGNAKNDISPALLGRLLRDTPNIVGIKSSNDDLVRFQDYVQVGGEDFIPCFGVDELMLGGLILGSHAQISGNANSFPEPFIELYNAFQSGDIERAQQLQKLVNAIVNIHHAGQTPAFFKASLKLRGVRTGKVRLPMRELTSHEVEEVKYKIVELGLL